VSLTDEILIRLYFCQC